MEDQELYLTEMLSLCVRKGKTLLIVALVFAALLGGWKLRREIKTSQDLKYSAEQIEARYQDALLDYEQQKENLERAIEDNEKLAAETQDYLENSLLMQIDPYNKYETSIYFGFSDIDEAAWDQVHYSATSLDFVYGRISNQYLVCWNGMNLSKDLGVAGYAEVPDKYIREVLSVSNQAGSVLCITAISTSAAESEKLADALYETLADWHPTAMRGSYEHSLVLLNKTTKPVIDMGLAEAQKSKKAAVEEYRTSIDDLKTQLEELKEPTREEGYGKKAIFKSAVKFSVLGAVAGVTVACFGILLWMVMSNVMISSYQMERQLGVECLGAAKGKNTLFDRWADKLGGERRWSNREQAVSYAVGKLATKVESGTSVLLTSTLCEGKCGDAAETLKKSLTAQGYKVNCIYDAIHDPAFMEAAKESDGMVLVETQGISRMQDVVDILKLAKSMEKSVCGALLA